MAQTTVSFANMGLAEGVVAQVKRLKFQAPTPVQQQVIPLMLGQKNIAVEAPTGTGKTAAYGLPLLSRLDVLKKTTYALVLTPSRELALQVATALRSYSADDKLRIGVVYGGISIAEAEKIIRQEPHILIAVPGMLRNIMGHTKYDYFWRDIKHLIVDEGDKLLEAGFQADFDEIRKHIRKTAQVCFFSATLSADAEGMIKERVPDATMVRINPRQVFRNIRFWNVQAMGKREQALATLLHTQKIDKALIFCSRRDDINALTGFLRNFGLRAEAYHGSQEQQERANILARFRDGRIQYLVASDLAARGLDIADLPCVVHVNIPKEYDFYLHRVGRTGRAGNRGTVYNIVASTVEAAYLENHRSAMGIPFDSFTLPAQEEQPQTRAIANAKWTKFHLSRGKKDKIRTGDIVGFLTQNAGLTADEIGTITIYETYSIVDMPLFAAANLQAYDSLKIKGLSLKIRKYSVEEMEKKADKVRKLVRKRNIE